MQGTVTITPAGAATIHTYTAPETGWRANSHIIELASQIVLFDAPRPRATRGRCWPSPAVWASR